MMPEFEPGDLVTLKYPERWPLTVRLYGYLWLVERASYTYIRRIDGRSVATGGWYSFNPDDLKGADDD
jgi:hypothetical protein